MVLLFFFLSSFVCLCVYKHSCQFLWHNKNTNTWTTIADYSACRLYKCSSWLCESPVHWQPVVVTTLYLVLLVTIIPPSASRINGSWFLDQQSVGATPEPIFQAESLFLGCQNTKNWMEIRHRLQTSAQNRLVGKWIIVLRYGLLKPVKLRIVIFSGQSWCSPKFVFITIYLYLL